MTACIVVLNREAPAAVLPTLAQPSSPAAARSATPSLEKPALEASKA